MEAGVTTTDGTSTWDTFTVLLGSSRGEAAGQPGAAARQSPAAAAAATNPQNPTQVAVLMDVPDMDAVRYRPRRHPTPCPMTASCRKTLVILVEA
jgi:hypothetical protein